MKTRLITLITFFISFSNLFSQVAVTCEIGDCKNGYGKCTYYDSHFGKRMRFTGIFRNEKFHGPGTIYNLNDEQFLLMANFSKGEFIRPLNSSEKKTRDKYTRNQFYKNIDFIMENVLINVTKVYKYIKFEHDYQTIKPDEPWDVQSFLYLKKGELSSKQAKNLGQFIDEYIKKKINPDKKLYGGFHFLQYVPSGKKPYVLDFPINTKLGDWKKASTSQKSEVTFKNGIVASSHFSDIFGTPLGETNIMLPNNQYYTITTREGGIPTDIYCYSSPLNMSRQDLALRRVPFLSGNSCVEGFCIANHKAKKYGTFQGIDPDAQGVLVCEYDENAKCKNPILVTHDGFVIYLNAIRKNGNSMVFKGLIDNQEVEVMFKNNKLVSATGEFSSNENFYYAKKNKMKRKVILEKINKNGYKVVQEKSIEIQTEGKKVSSTTFKGLQPNTSYAISTFIPFDKAEYQVVINTTNNPFIFSQFASLAGDNESASRTFKSNLPGGYENIFFKTPKTCPTQACSFEFNINYDKTDSGLYPDKFPILLFLVTNE